MTAKIAVIGECMLELTHGSGPAGSGALPMKMGYGGDTINTSIYLSRNGVTVSYVTGLGDDLMSDWLVQEWQEEGIDCSLVARLKNSVPGMYMINVDESGERSFLYWRKHSPASRIFDNQGSAEIIFQSLANHEYLYLSGISLAILDDGSCDRLVGLLDNYRRQGGKIIFDGNYRPTLWSSAEYARSVYERMYKMTDIALPTFEDEQELFGFGSPQEVMDTIQQHGVNEIVVKMGGEGCLSLYQGVTTPVEAKAINPVDTTAAGDSFNAGYLAARFIGSSGVEACLVGHDLAGRVIQHKGAIIPK